MSWPPEVRTTIKRLHNVQHTLTSLFTNRERAIELLLLATLCHEHLLLVGPPGTAKTEIINRYTALLDMRGFHYLLTRFTEPSELFGPLDLAEFQQGRYTIRTEGMLPTAQIAFLDEVFQGSSAILNTLLTLLNERVFFNGANPQKTPLICLIGATNSVPDDPALRAFADRFVLRLEVDKVADEQIDELLDHGWELERERIEQTKLAALNRASATPLRRVAPADVLDLHGRLLEVDLNDVRIEYGRVIRELRAEGVELSDRRAVKGLKLIAGAALLREADKAAIADLWPLMHLWSRPEEADVIKEVVLPRLVEAGAATMTTTRPVADILLDLETITGREKLVTSEAAWGAHLMDLNKLRRELINDHPTAQDGRKQIEEAIQRGLQRLQGTTV